MCGSTQATRHDRSGVRVHLSTRIRSTGSITSLNVKMKSFVDFTPQARVAPSNCVGSERLSSGTDTTVLLRFLRHVTSRGLVLPCAAYFFFSGGRRVNCNNGSGVPPRAVRCLTISVNTVNSSRRASRCAISVYIGSKSNPCRFKLHRRLIKLYRSGTVPCGLSVCPFCNDSTSTTVGTN